MSDGALPTEIRLSNTVREELGALFRAVTSEKGRRRIFERVLTPEERSEFAGLRTEFIINAIAAATHVHPYLALLKIASQIDFTITNRHEWLSRELGLVGPPTSRSRPSWSRRAGRLLLGDREIRRVLVRKRATNVEQILNAFEGSGWPGEVDIPGLDPGRLHQAVYTLNARLHAIRFSVCEGGTAVNWCYA